MIEVGYWWGNGHSESVHAIRNDTKDTTDDIVIIERDLDLFRAQARLT